MDLSALNSTLPPDLADAERDMGDKFRAAALSITTLYRTSLANTKQAYHVGYAAALADVLSKVQSDIGAGEDAAAALARLMDWAEARQTAMDAFAADDDEAQPQARAQPSASASTSASTRFPRPSSAPADSRMYGNTARDGPGPSSLRNSHSGIGSANTATHSEAVVADDPASTPGPSKTRLTVAGALERSRSPSDGALMAPSSSSPVSSPLVVRPVAPPRLQRNPSARVTPVSSVPTSNFNFSLPAAASLELDFPPSSGPAQTGPIGAKRPIIDAEMADGPSTPVRRSAKRRQMGISLGDEEKGADRRRRRGPRAPSPV